MKNTFALMLMALVVGLAGCGKENNENSQLPPVIILNSAETIDVSYGGGNFPIEYILRNAEPRHPFVDTETEWIEVLNVNNASTLLHIPFYDGPIRRGEVLLSFPGAETVRVTVVQHPRGSYAERVHLTVQGITLEQAEVVIRNPHQDSWVCLLVKTTAYYDEQISPDPAAWVASYVPEMYRQWQEYCTTSGEKVIFEEYWGITDQNDAARTFEGLKFDTPYMAIAMELDPFGNYTGEVVLFPFRTAKLPPLEEVEVTFSVTLAYDAAATENPYTITYEPSDKTVQYFAKAYTAADLDQKISSYKDLKAYVTDYLATSYSEAALYTGDAIWEGDVEVDPRPETLVVSIVLCGCDKYGRVTSEPVRKDFTVNLSEDSSQTL